MLLATLDKIVDPKRRAMFRSIKIIGLSRTVDGSVSVLIAFPSSLVSTFEYDEPPDIGPTSTHG
jgi:hypothetical protein